MKIKTKNRRAIASIGIVAIAALLMVSVVAYNLVDAAPKGQPKGADKTVIGKPGLDVIPNTAEWQTIISGTIKTSTNTDLRITHFQECAIHTGLKLDAFNEKETSAIREQVRLLIDGKIIHATFGDVHTVDDPATEFIEPVQFGLVTMCSRAYQIDTNIISSLAAVCTPTTCPEELFFDSYIRTKQTHGWQWVALNVGSDMDHLVEIQARTFTTLDGMKTGSDEAQEIASTTESCMKDAETGTICPDTVLEVGKTSMIIVADKLAVSASLDP